MKYMKYLKLIAMALLPLAFAACSDDDDINGGSATVGFTSSQITLAENASSLTLPIVVEGEHNGLIKVQVAVTNLTGTSVVNDETVIMTSGNLLFPADVNEVNVELRTNVNTPEDDYNRSFTVEIIAAEGATVSTSSCVVNIQEMVDPYNNLTGNWILPIGGNDVPVTITGREDRSGFDCTMEYDGVPVDWDMDYSPSGLQVVCGSVVARDIDFGEIGVFNIQFGYVNGGYWYTDNIPAMWNETFDTITLDAGITGGLYTSAGAFGGYTWFSSETTMTKVQ